MEWYLPLTLISGSGLIIMSSASQIISLNAEIERLATDKDYAVIVDRKVKQLKRLTLAMSLLYGSMLFIIVSALINAADIKALEPISFYVLMAGIFCLLFAIIFLVIYAVISVQVRQQQVQIAIKKH